MVATFLKFELKKLLRDEMTRVMLFYPLVLGGLVRLFINRNLLTVPFASATAVVLVVLAAGFDFGMIAGFSLLDDRDDGVLLSIRISPVSLSLYLWFKVGFAFLMAVGASLATMLVSGSFAIAPLNMLLVALLAAMQVPINAFLVSALASDRAEGLAAIRVTGILIFISVVAWFFLDWKQWFFALIPGFWPAKAVQSLLLAAARGESLTGSPLGFAGYIGVGFLWCLIVMGLTYILFKKKSV
jgi:fluoroquinolone transport system permease protein